MKNISKTMFGALALVGVSTSVAFAGNAVGNEGVEEVNVLHREIIVDNGVVTGSSNYFINNDGAVLMYDTDDGINYNVFEGNLEEILAQIENQTFDMSNPFAIFESDYNKDLFLLVWDGSELLQHRNSDSVGQSVMQILVSEDGTTITEKESVYGLDDNGQLIIINNN